MKISPDLLRRCLVIAGPTAVGKTELSLTLAERLGGEICSLDSMAIYREMDIGTAKPLPHERRGVRHHLIDIVDPSNEFSVAEYLAAAQASIESIVDRNKVPIFVGGTGLYLRSLLRGVFEGPQADLQLRTRLEAEAATDPQSLHTRLAEVDPPLAAKFHPNDIRRIVRALEVYEITGRPLSELQREQAPGPEDRPAATLWLRPDRTWLHERINRRVDLMLDAGWLAEVDRLRARPGGLSKTASQALGYQELIDVRSGALDLPEAVTLIKTRTRQFAKRQETWFRNLEECSPVDRTPDATPADLADIIVGKFEADRDGG